MEKLRGQWNRRRQIPANEGNLVTGFGQADTDPVHPLVVIQVVRYRKNEFFWPVHALPVNGQY